MKKIIFILFIVHTSLRITHAQWVVLNTGVTSNLRSVHFVNSSTGFAAGAGGVMIKTTNSGMNWNPLTTGLTSDINSVCFYNSTNGAACGNSGSIIMTTNSGSNWNIVPSGVSANLFAISMYDNINGVCTGSNGTLLYTTNGGTNWVIAVDGFISTYYGIHMVSMSSAYACGVNTIFQPLIARTTNGGANWTYSVFYLNSNEGNLRDIHLFSSTEGITVSNVWNGQGGISYTSNSGVNWTTLLYTNALNGLDITGNTGYAAGVNGSVLKSIDRGASWLTQSSGTSGVLRSVDFIDSLSGFICGDGGIILKTTNGGITLITPISTEIPKQFSLSQNYPNPFNPTTKIKFDVAASNLTLSGAKGLITKLTIYDLLGREVATLVNEQLSPGTYEVDFDGSNFSSGIYYYTLQTEAYTETRKMVLMK